MLFFLMLMILASISTIVFGILQFGMIDGSFILFNHGMGFTLSLVAFLWSIFIFALTRNDIKEKEYKKELKEYKEKAETIKKESEQKFAVLRDLLIKERDLIQKTNFETNSHFKQLFSVVKDKPTSKEELDFQYKKFNELMTEVCSVYTNEHDDKFISISDMIMKQMLDILSGKEDKLPDKPEK
jgi:hypothetical protein